MADFQPLKDAIIKGDRNAAEQLTKEALDQNTPPEQILNDGLVTAMAFIGKRFKANEIFVPEVLIAARAMKHAMTILEPALTDAGIKPEFTAIIGTVQGDLHDIGKNLVAMMWKGANFNVVDLGTNVPPEKFVDAAKENNAHIVGLSALLTTTMPAMQQAVDAIRAADLPNTRILIGGAPVTQEYANQIGADGFAPDAASAVDTAHALLA